MLKPWNRDRSKNKFGAIPTEYDGMKFASKAEARRARDLDLLKKAGQIIGWAKQVPFMLGSPEDKYVVDFLVFHLDGTVVAEDVKGRETPKFARDKKLWRRHGLCPLHVIKGKKVEVVLPVDGEDEQETP